MTKEELKIWFLDKYNSCYSVIDSDNPKVIYMIYDIDYIRAKKLANILNKEVEYPTEVKGIYLFEIHLELGYFIYNIDEIFTYLKHNYIVDYLEINTLISYFLEDNNNLKTITPIWMGIKVLIDLDNLKVIKNI